MDLKPMSSGKLRSIGDVSSATKFNDEPIAMFAHVPPKGVNPRCAWRFNTIQRGIVDCSREATHHSVKKGTYYCEGHSGRVKDAKQFRKPTGEAHDYSH